MRQRIPVKSPARGDLVYRGTGNSGTWESNADTGDAATAAASTAIDPSMMNSTPALPMYNPLHYSGMPGGSVVSSASGASAPTGNIHPASPSLAAPAVAWHKVQYQDPMLVLDSRHRHAPPSSAGSWNTGGGIQKPLLSSLTPTLIPDSSYQTFLRTGQPVFKKKPKDAWNVDTICCAKFCAGFCWVAVAFLVFVGILFDTQPLYIPGSLPKEEQYVNQGGSAKVQVFYSVNPTERLRPATNAFRAAYVYAFTGFLCLAYAYNLHFWMISRYRQYQDVPDNESTVPSFHRANSFPTRAGGELPMTAPTSTGVPGGGRRTSHLYHQPYGEGNSPWDRVMEATRGTYNRVRIYVASNWLAEPRVRRREAGPKEV